MRIGLSSLVAVLVVAGQIAQGQTFRLNEEESSIGRHDLLLAVADLNHDGRDDIVVGSRYEALDNGKAEDRLEKFDVRVLLGTGNGRFRPAPGDIVRPFQARRPMVVAADFNNDEQLDLAVYDYGVYVVGESNYGHGNPPQLFMSRDGGRRLFPSTALADAVRAYNEQNPNPINSDDPADMHLKDLAAGDLDGDGDVDLWVQSMGGANVGPHMMVNNGDGTWTLDPERAPDEVNFNKPDEWWYFGSVHLADVDGDGDLDVLQGQSRDDDPVNINEVNIVLVNDGTGHFPSRIELPHAGFHGGFTRVSFMATHDINGDGMLDILLSHQRNDLSTDAETGVLSGTGRYIQTLINRGDGTFGDETSTWIKGQGLTRPQRFPDGEPLWNEAGMVLRDLDRDGCVDLLMTDAVGPIRKQSPIAYRNNGSGQFEAFPPELFTDDPDFGYGARVADVNGDGLPDFVVASWDWGPDGLEDTEDDFTMLYVLQNMTPPQPVRCGEQ